MDNKGTRCHVDENSVSVICSNEIKRFTDMSESLDMY